MIVLEGPDGGGKSSLSRQLAQEFQLPLHERASDSKKGPVSNLFEWAYHDVITMPEQPLSIYDRHPFLSEYVYGPIIRGGLPDGFKTNTAHALIRMMAPRVLIVLCRPPIGRLEDAVRADRDMPGVTRNIKRIAAAYDALRIFWPGQIITYDYTDPNTKELVLARCRIHVAAERNKRGLL